MKTKQDYAAYCQSVQNFLTSNNIKPRCHSPKENEQEPYFSWQPCECCGSSLGGNREDYTFAQDTDTLEIFEASICQDCVYFLAYGQLDDLTMLELEGSAQ